ncbi:MAG: hypothetical protein IID08_06105 [Candidatus Hydrogenedentes bacterium]|nr:hypothetical protein [Candidatus Hydrogenedentota bacterium]
MRREGEVVSYRARLDGDTLLIEVKHAPGWHTYTMDNTERAQKKSGKEKPDTELPTRIEASGGIEIIGPWRQTDPKDLSQEEIEWYTWGFEGTAHFAVQIRRTSDEPVRIRIRAQACNATSCSMIDGLVLDLPATPEDSKAPATGRLDLSSLVPVTSAK